MLKPHAHRPRDHRVALLERGSEERIARLELRERRGARDLGGELRREARRIERFELDVISMR